jgi:hypothetical protein
MANWDFSCWKRSAFDPFGIVTILPLEGRKEYDIGLPVLSPRLVRKKTLADEIASLNVMAFQTILLPMTC